MNCKQSRPLDVSTHGSLREYLIGFVLSALFTIVPFLLVMQDVFSDRQIMVSVIM
ncbi:hypothetical protein H0G72_03305, partial [Liberibacter sp. Z1]|nr:hypothetical protein [Candidatus Liberibacter sp.]